MNNRSHEPDGDESLLKRAREGDKEAIELLLSLYRERLKQMVAMRIDPAIHPRSFYPTVVKAQAFTGVRIEPARMICPTNRRHRSASSLW